MRCAYTVEFSGVLADGDVVEACLLGYLFDGVKAFKHELDHMRVGQRIDLDDPSYHRTASAASARHSSRAHMKRRILSASFMSQLSLFPNIARVAYLVPSFLGLVPELRGKRPDPM